VHFYILWFANLNKKNDNMLFFSLFCSIIEKKERNVKMSLLYSFCRTADRLWEQEQMERGECDI
jgi:hypothetical protein